ncbi:unnamed protein product [Bemisia tabaci]|uniref:C2H2-type domain-containing protein n=1 Tax=Bemisia tabaci TaxID=7038 RepID=A0A9P0F846_BEMTA|nr:unnamed protein product [Bemisia tabaci]
MADEQMTFPVVLIERLAANEKYSVAENDTPKMPPIECKSQDISPSQEVIKREFSAQIVPVIKQEPRYEFEGGTSSHLDISINLVGFNVKNEIKPEVTAELVGSFPLSLSSNQPQYQETLKIENRSEQSEIEYDSKNSSENCSRISPRILEHHEVQNTKCNDDTMTLSSFISNVTVKLVDMFSDEARKRGEVHSSNSFCSCIFCRRVYMDTSNAHLLSMNLKNASEHGPPKSQQKLANHSGQRLSNKIKKLFRCAVCQVQCKNISSWKAHWVVHKGNYKCFLCKVRCESEKKFVNHMRDAHSIGKAYRCSICSKSFRLLSCLLQHFKVHIEDRPFKCDLCSMAFKIHQHLTVHKENIHLKAKPYSCDLCTAKFSTKPILSDHMRSVHSNKRPFECKVCCKSFKLKSHLVKHSRMHSSEKPFKCELCPATFRYPQSAKEHLRVHSNEKPYLCSICPKSFKYSSQLFVHEKRHSKKRAFVCDLCKTKFKTRETISKHIRIVHLGEKPVKCNLCTYKTINTSSLKKHMAVHEETRPFKCTLCSAKFAVSLYLKIHLKTIHSGRSFDCEICHMKFPRKRSLTLHRNVHKEERQFKCDLCCTEFSKSVDLTKHMDGHDAGGKFFCAHCPSAFKYKKKIITHLKIHSK